MDIERSDQSLPSSQQETPISKLPVTPLPEDSPVQPINSTRKKTPAEIVAEANNAISSNSSVTQKGNFGINAAKAAAEKLSDLPPIEHGFVPNPKAHSQRFERKKVAFLDNFCDFLTPEHTCQAIGISLRTFHQWCQSDKNFNEAFARIDRHMTAKLIHAATRRSLIGSDSLLMFLIKARDPKYRDRVQAEIDPKQLDQIVSTFMNALRKTVPNTCPHCKVNLNLSEKVQEMLIGLSKGVKA